VGQAKNALIASERTMLGLIVSLKDPDHLPMASQLHSCGLMKGLGQNISHTTH
jgi:hypothetical protein